MSDLHDDRGLRGPRFGVVALLTLTAGSIAMAPNPHPDPLTYTWHELAPGVWTGIRENSPRFPVMGTTTFVVSDAGVVVFDGGGLPLMSERTIEQIRSVTDRPVTHVAVSHWRQDHNFGIRAFVDAFPAGDIVLWLPDERIVATGDLVVRPTPYGFGSYPREWAATLRGIRELGFTTLIPGHGDIQRDDRYLDLLIETLELVADQMGGLVAEGVPEDEAVGRVDFSSVEDRFTQGDDFLAGRFDAWFKQPIARAAYRIATGEPPENIQ